MDKEQLIAHLLKQHVLKMANLTGYTGSLPEFAKRLNSINCVEIASILEKELWKAGFPEFEFTKVGTHYFVRDTKTQKAYDMGHPQGITQAQMQVLYAKVAPVVPEVEKPMPGLI